MGGGNSNKQKIILVRIIGKFIPPEFLDVFFSDHGVVLNMPVNL